MNLLLHDLVYPRDVASNDVQSGSVYDLSNRFDDHRDKEDENYEAKGCVDSLANIVASFTCHSNA